MPVRLTGKKRDLYATVKRAGPNGISTERLFHTLYNDDANGGPDSGYKIIAVFVNGLNKKLAPFGEKVQGGRSGHGVYTNYVLLKK